MYLTIILKRKLEMPQYYSTLNQMRNWSEFPNRISYNLGHDYGYESYITMAMYGRVNAQWFAFPLIFTESNMWGFSLHCNMGFDQSLHF